MGSLRMFDEELSSEKYLPIPSIEFWGLTRCKRDTPNVWIGMRHGEGKFTDEIERDMIVMIMDQDNERDTLYAIVREIKYEDDTPNFLQSIESVVNNVGYTQFAIYNGAASNASIEKERIRRKLPDGWKRVVTRDSVVDNLDALYNIDRIDISNNSNVWSSSKLNEFPFFSPKYGFKALRLELLPALLQPQN